jgi:tetratricopeptide (TPR) repeat protein
MSWAQETLKIGVAYHQAGQLQQAEQIYRQVLAANPHQAEAHNNLGTIRQSAGDLAAALACYQNAVAAKPDYADAYNNLGTAYQDLGQLDAAADCYRRALAAEPRYAKGLYNLGALLLKQEKIDQAHDAFERAIRLQPNYAEAHYGLALTLAGRQDFARAETALGHVIGLRPDWPEAHISLGDVYRQQQKAAEAISSYRQALACAPQNAQANNSLGLLLQGQGDLDEAIACYRLAAAAAPEAGAPHTNLGNAMFELARLDEAVACYDRSLTCWDDPQTHLNRALVRLSQGRFDEGWGEFAWRLKCPDYPRRAWNQPLWDGAAFVGRTLLVHAEQGLGDTLQFVRYLPAVRRLGGQVILEVQPPLVSLLTGSDIPDVVARGSDLPPFDVQVPLLHLPGMLHTTLQTVPADVPYLAADPNRMARWRTHFAALDGLKIGIAWQGDRLHAADRRRSIPLAAFAPLATVAGVRLFSLQKGPGAEQLPALADRLPIDDLAPQLDNDGGAFVDTAAVMKCLDLVITSDTATAHLAGALGVDVWLALAAAPDWRWLQHRDDSPWYPTMRLFRQTRAGDWAEVFERIAGELKRLTTHHA